MAEAAEQAQHDFWRPPMQMAAPSTAEHVEMVEACDQCGTEFIVGARYCHTCGAVRSDSTPAPKTQTNHYVSTFLALGERLGLPLAAFIAFLVGLVCVFGAMGVGVIFSARTVLDWQAVQVWRIEWLLGAVAAFCAGCVLKRTR